MGILVLSGPPNSLSKHPDEFLSETGTVHLPLLSVLILRTTAWAPVPHLILAKLQTHPDRLKTLFIQTHNPGSDIAPPDWDILMRTLEGPGFAGLTRLEMQRHHSYSLVERETSNKLQSLVSFTTWDSPLASHLLSM